MNQTESALRFKQIREGILKLRQQDLASELGCSRQHVGRVESGRAEYTFSQLQKMSELIGVPVCSFFDGYIHAQIPDWAADYIKVPAPKRRKLDRAIISILDILN
ncbi:MAG: hypothetical protein CMI09_09335 [Oceanospirillaceae bacterium]|nr:hypothetical protein [Oceanospirillaceae bacterium]